MNQDERILYVTGQEKEKQLRSATNASMIFVTDKRIIIRNTTSLGMKDVIEDMPYDHISSLKLHEGLLSSAYNF